MPTGTKTTVAVNAVAALGAACLLAVGVLTPSPAQAYDHFQCSVKITNNSTERIRLQSGPSYSSTFFSSVSTIPSSLSRGDSFTFRYTVKPDSINGDLGSLQLPRISFSYAVSTDEADLNFSGVQLDERTSKDPSIDFAELLDLDLDPRGEDTDPHCLMSDPLHPTASFEVGMGDFRAIPNPAEIEIATYGAVLILDSGGSSGSSESSEPTPTIQAPEDDMVLVELQRFDDPTSCLGRDSTHGKTAACSNASLATSSTYWYYSPSGKTLRSAANPSMCLLHPDRAEGANPTLGVCLTSLKWDLQDDGTILSHNSSRCLADMGTGSPVEFYECSRAAEQKWRLVYVASPDDSACSGQPAQINLYDGSDYTGAGIGLKNLSAANLAQYGWDDKAVSMQAVSGTWELYRDANLGGTMLYLAAPGQSPSVDRRKGTYTPATSTLQSGFSSAQLLSCEAEPIGSADHRVQLFRMELSTGFCLANLGPSTTMAACISPLTNWYWDPVSKHVASLQGPNTPGYGKCLYRNGSLVSPGSCDQADADYEWEYEAAGQRFRDAADSEACMLKGPIPVMGPCSDSRSAWGHAW